MLGENFGSVSVPLQNSRKRHVATSPRSVFTTHRHARSSHVALVTPVWKRICSRRLNSCETHFA